MSRPMHWREPDYYAIMGVPPTATQDEIMHAFRRLVRLTHPDVDPGEPATVERFRLINAAREILGDAAKRAAYDRARRMDERRPGADTARTVEVRQGALFDEPIAPRERLLKPRGATVRVGPVRWHPSSSRRSRDGQADRG